MVMVVAFMVGGYGCRILLSKMSGKTLLPLLLIGYAVSMTALFLVAKYTHPTLTTILIPFCIMAVMNGASYPIAVSNALSAYPEVSGKAAAKVTIKAPPKVILVPIKIRLKTSRPKSSVPKKKVTLPF